MKLTNFCVVQQPHPRAHMRTTLAIDRAIQQMYFTVLYSKITHNEIHVTANRPPYWLNLQNCHRHKWGPFILRLLISLSLTEVFQEFTFD